MGIEPTTPCLQSRCSSQLSYVPGKGSLFCQPERQSVAFVPVTPTILAMTPAFDQFSDLVRRRRTNMRVDPNQPVDPAVIGQLCELATWAPNHKLTEPWRFAAITGDARAELGNVTAAFMAELGETNEAKLDKTRGKYLRAPVILMMASAWGSNERRDEDRDALSAAVQNVLLGATAAGLNSYWGTGAICHAPAVKAMCGFPETADVIGAIYLGWSIGDVPVPNRATPAITWVS
jgi:nitroreductase